jgi:hypothetical protein
MTIYVISQRVFLVVSVYFVKIKIFKTVILPVVLYGCDTWSLTLRKEYRLRVFENSVENIWTQKGGRRVVEKTA